MTDSHWSMGLALVIGSILALTLILIYQVYDQVKTEE